MSHKRSARPDWDRPPHSDKRPRKNGNDTRYQPGYLMGKNGKHALYLRRGSVNPGDVGIWVTCARQQEHKAARELQMLFDEYAEKMYGIKQEENTWIDSTFDPAVGAPPADHMRFKKDRAKKEGKKEELVTTARQARRAGHDEDDIESLLNREIAAIKEKTSDGQDWFASSTSVFAPVRFNVECLFFIRTRPPVHPVDLVDRICQDAMDATRAAVNGDYSYESFSSVRSHRYVNRLTPITFSGRSNEHGLVEVAKAVLPEFFKMADNSASGEDKVEDGVTEEEKPAYSYAIRPAIRHHDVLQRLDVITKIASMIDQEHHKVDLENPDKIVLVEIFRTTIGMSVVGKSWTELKKYNMTEIINLPVKSNQKPPEGQADEKHGGKGKEAAKEIPHAEKPCKVEEADKTGETGKEAIEKDEPLKKDKLKAVGDAIKKEKTAEEEDKNETVGDKKEGTVSEKESEKEA